MSLALIPTFISSAISSASATEVPAGIATDCTVVSPGYASWLPIDVLNQAYACVSNHTRYSTSKNSIARIYQDWHRRDDYPVKSPAHGGHYVAIYANDIAITPPTQQVLSGIAKGSAIATPIFNVGQTGKVSAGPMLIMEKMQPGFNTHGGDWRYTLIAPDGAVLSDNSSTSIGQFNFCKHCSGVFADSVFAALLKGEPPRAPLKPQEVRKNETMPQVYNPVPLTPVQPATPQKRPLGQAPKQSASKPKGSPMILDPNAPLLDPNAPLLDPSAPLAAPATKTTAKAAKPKASFKGKPSTEAENKILDSLKTLRRSEPKA
ncbi:MAG: hypothetical protein O2912_08905 [Proteobacteria bacterium]|nr:hypothetical protein [Pseudomonadota bacterium]